MIWIALNVITNLIEIYILYFFTRTFLDEKHKTPVARAVPFATWFTVILICNIYRFDGNYTFVAAIAGICLIVFMNYNNKPHQKLFVIILYLLFIALSEVVAMGFVMEFGEYIFLNKTNDNQMFLGMFASTFFRLFVILYVYNVKSLSLSNISYKLWLLVISVPAISVGIIFYIVFEVFVKAGFRDSLFFIYISLGMLAFNFVIIYLLGEIVRFIQTKNRLEYDNLLMSAQKKEALSIQELHEKIGKVHHDLKNHLIVIEEYVQTNRLAELAEYINRLKPSVTEYDKIVYTAIDELDAIINYKHSIAKDNGIDINMDITLKQRPHEINIHDINIILSNGLDNAIECLIRCEKILDKRIDLLIESADDRLMIRITNPTQFKPLTSAGKYISSKRANGEQGVGIESIKSVVEKYSGLIDISCKDGVFSLKVVLPNRVLVANTIQ